MVTTLHSGCGHLHTTLHSGCGHQLHATLHSGCGHQLHATLHSGCGHLHATLPLQCLLRGQEASERVAKERRLRARIEREERIKKQTDNFQRSLSGHVYPYAHSYSSPMQACCLTACLVCIRTITALVLPYPP